MSKIIPIRYESIVVLRGNMDGEFTFGNRWKQLRQTPNFMNHYISLNLVLLHVVDPLSGYNKLTFLCPLKHIDLLDFIRKQNCFYINKFNKL